MIVEIVEQGEVVTVPWPEGWEAIRVGDTETDLQSLLKDTDWKPTVDIKEELKTTISYYNE